MTDVTPQIVAVDAIGIVAAADSVRCLGQDQVPTI
jgi:hypothetical protein